MADGSRGRLNSAPRPRGLGTAQQHNTTKGNAMATCNACHKCNYAQLYTARTYSVQCIDGRTCTKRVSASDSSRAFYETDFVSWSLSLPEVGLRRSLGACVLVGSARTRGFALAQPPVCAALPPEENSQEAIPINLSFVDGGHRQGEEGEKASSNCSY